MVMRLTRAVCVSEKVVSRAVRMRVVRQFGKMNAEYPHPRAQQT